MITVRSAPAVLGYGSALSILLAAFSYTGGTLSGFAKDPNVDEVARKEYLRKNRRRSIEETVNELGEGRGMSTPQRRRIQNLGCHDIKGREWSNMLTIRRSLRARLRAKESRAHQRAIRHRCASPVPLGSDLINEGF